MRVSAVIFDLFETLTDFSFHDYCLALTEMAGLLDADSRSFVARWDEEWPRCEAGEFRSVEEYVTCIMGLCGARASVDRVAEAAALHGAFQKAALVPRADAIETLESLRRQGIATGVVTNCPIETPAQWPTSRLAQHVDEAVFSTVEKTRKPQPDLFLTCTQRLKVMPGNSLFVGDGANDELIAASGLGMTAVLLDNGNAASRRRLRDWSGRTINALSEVLGLTSPGVQRLLPDGGQNGTPQRLGGAASAAG